MHPDRSLSAFYDMDKSFLETLFGKDRFEKSEKLKQSL
jgi:hypothetical protein